MIKPSTWHLRILYLLLLILICISIAPLWFYGTRILATNQETLKTKEQELQTVTSQSLAQEISLYEENVRGHLSDFFTSVTALAVQIPASKYVTDAQLNGALKDFASQQ